MERKVGELVSLRGAGNDQSCMRLDLTRNSLCLRQGEAKSSSEVLISALEHPQRERDVTLSEQLVSKFRNELQLVLDPEG